MKRVIEPACILAAILGAALVSEEARLLAFGWIAFLRRNLPRVTANPEALVTGAIATGLCVVTLDLFARWCYKSLPKNPEAQPCRWRFRWTVSVMIGLGLLFAVTISVMGIARQVGWLLSAQ
jgi:hypothetical protein